MQRCQFEGQGIPRFRGPFSFLTSRSTMELRILTPTMELRILPPTTVMFSYIRADISLIQRIGAIYKMHAWWDLFDTALAHLLAWWDMYATALVQHLKTENT